MERLKSAFFRISCGMEAVALIYFLSNQLYEIPAFIASKWVLTLFYFTIEYIIVKHKEKLNSIAARDYEQ